MMRIDFDHFIGDAAKELRNGASRVRRGMPSFSPSARTRVAVPV